MTGRIAQPCFCGCGGVACWHDRREAPFSRYLPGHAPGERSPVAPAPAASPPIQARPAGPQGDLFGTPGPEPWRSPRRRLTS